MKFYDSLSFRVLGGSIILLLILFTLFSYFSIRFQNDQMMSLVFQSANRTSDLIRNSTHYSMLLNRKEDVYQIITMIGREPGVEGIRIYNKRGEIMFSTRKEEEGTAVDRHAEACFVCHEQEKPLQSLPTDNRTRVYQSPDGHRILGLINPIRNEASCSNADCHAHPADRTVLGVLDVRMSLAQVDSDIARSSMKMIGYAALAALILIFTSLLFLYSTVLRPVRRLTVATEKISSGILDHTIPIDSKDEIGLLANAFNRMTDSLRKASEENLRWSQELETRVQDKTEELKRIHEQILQIEKMASLGKLSATVAHELNNPLEGILTYAKLMAKRLRKLPAVPAPLGPMLEELDLVVQETQRCGSIVKNLLLFSRKQVADLAAVPVDRVIDKVAQLVGHHLKISNVQFSTEYRTEDRLLLCDENQIEQAFVALFVNAVEAMPDGGKLTLEVSRCGNGGLRMVLHDTGIGIPAEDLPHIFEPFFTTKREGKGVGLGLSVVYGIVERHGGDIGVKSEPGKGTSFTITFPPPDAPAGHFRTPEHSGAAAGSAGRDINA